MINDQRNMTAINQNQKSNNEDDKNALFLHYKKYLNNNETSDWQRELANCYEEMFLEKPKKEMLDMAEGWWIAKLSAGIKQNGDT